MCCAELSKRKVHPTEWTVDGKPIQFLQNYLQEYIIEAALFIMHYHTVLNSECTWDRIKFHKSIFIMLGWGNINREFYFMGNVHLFTVNIYFCTYK